MKRTRAQKVVFIGMLLLQANGFRCGAVTAYEPLPNDPYSGTIRYNLNEILGAARFYSYGITGQGARVANIESGPVWNGHESLGHVTAFIADEEAAVPTLDDQSHATAVSMLIAGRDPNAGETINMLQSGIAFGAELESGAIASAYYGGGSFEITTHTLLTPYEYFFGHSDVINSSWGNNSPAARAGVSPLESVAIDALAFKNPGTLMVASAGNSGPDAGTVGAPAAGYNTLAVGSLGLPVAGVFENDGSYDQVSYFSSRGPQDAGVFHQYNAPPDDYSWYYAPDARAPVDLVAPGAYIVSAHTSEVDAYAGQFGTSFSSPLVAGGAALLYSTSYALGGTEATRDARVIKAVLMNSADKLPGWDNGQAVDAEGIITTEQSLDFALGTGRMNLDRAFTQYVEGTADVEAFPDSGSARQVLNTGWDFGTVGGEGWQNFYLLDAPLTAGEFFTATLTWFRDRDYSLVEGVERSADYVDPVENLWADLDLYLFSYSRPDELSFNIESVFARSISDFNMSEHFSVLIDETDYYGLMVGYDETIWGNPGSVDYGLAWYTGVIPEPATVLIFSSGFLALGFWRRRRFRAVGFALVAALPAECHRKPARIRAGAEGLSGLLEHVEGWLRTAVLSRSVFPTALSGGFLDVLLSMLDRMDQRIQGRRNRIRVKESLLDRLVAVADRRFPRLYRWL